MYHELDYINSFFLCEQTAQVNYLGSVAQLKGTQLTTGDLYGTIVVKMVGVYYDHKIIADEQKFYTTI